MGAARFTLSFAEAQLWKRAWETELQLGSCFVRSETPLAAQTPVEVEVKIDGIGEAVVGARVAFVDVDDTGISGLRLDLATEDIARLRALYEHAHQTELLREPTSIRPVDPYEADLSQPNDSLEELVPGTVLDNRFEIEGHLASGGMGDVYRANHVFLRRPVALKLLKRTLANDPEMWARFQREAELVSQLDTPHVVRVFDFGKLSDGRPFLAMEFVDGTPFDMLLLEKKRLEPTQVVDLLGQVCEGLSEVHALGIVHRDLKPPNLILGKRRDGTPIAKILDFGIARAAEAAPTKNVTGMGMVVGTPHYLAPEQALADPLDARTDIYALGCVAFELLTGRPPFDTDNFQKLISMQIHEAPPHPASVWPGLSAFPRLCGEVLKALAKKREERQPDARAFAAALREALAPEPEPAPPPPAAALPSEWSDGASPAAAAPEAAPAVPAAPPPMAPMFETDAAAPAAAPAPRVLSLWADEAQPTGAPPADGRLKKALLEHGIDLPDAVADRMLSRRSGLGTVSGATVFAELHGVPSTSPVAQRLLARLLVETDAFGGVLVALDEDGLSLLFPGEQPEAATGRAALFAAAAREWVRDEALRAPDAPPALRLGLAFEEVALSAEAPPLDAGTVRRARALAGKVPAGELLVERDHAAAVADVLELKPAADGAALGDRKAVPIGSGRVVEREGILAALDKRLEELVLGRPAAMVITGEPGAGRSAICAELELRARHRDVFACAARGHGAWRDQPYGAIAELLCDAIGLGSAELETSLPQALTRLSIPPGTIEAVRVILGLSHPPTPFSPGQVVQAVRAVVQAVAGSRRALLLFDGLEAVERTSLEAFRELCARRTPRELVIGLSETGFAAARLAQLPALALPPLALDESSRFVAHALGGLAVSNAVAGLVHRSGRGLPALMQDWLFVLVGRGCLRRKGKEWALAAEMPELSEEALCRERLALLEPDVRRLFSAVGIAGDLLASQELVDLLPYPSARAPQRLVQSRVVRAVGRRQVSPVSDRFRIPIPGESREERQALHLKLADALLARGTHPPALAAEHLLAGGDPNRALAAFRKAAQHAVQARHPRALAEALKGGADAAGRMPKAESREVVKMRLDALSRAACNAVSAGDALWARALVDEAVALAEAGVATAELPLAVARVLRTEGRRAKAGEALDRAESEAGASPVRALCLAERGDARESEGALEAAAKAFEAAISAADGAKDLTPWYGEISFRSRMETRLAGVMLQRKEVDAAVTLFQRALGGWLKVGAPFAEARVLANLGAALVQKKDLEGAAGAFAESAATSGRAGDFLFQARQLLQQARVLKKLGNGGEALAVAREAKGLAARVFWDEGQQQADQV